MNLFSKGTNHIDDTFPFPLVVVIVEFRPSSDSEPDVQIDRWVALGAPPPLPVFAPYAAPWAPTSQGRRHLDLS